jgi:hypothetical protein
MTPITKDTRREEWQRRNFAGSIDWAVDLQTFSADEYSDESLVRPDGSTGCVMGEDVTIDSGSLCAFSCMYGFCPETLCECLEEGEMEALPSKQADVKDIVAYDANNVELNRLCKWACQYGYCPNDICVKSEPEVDTNVPSPEDLENYYNTTEAKLQNAYSCLIWKDPQWRDVTMRTCERACSSQIEAAQAEGRTTNYGCVAFFPGKTEIPWDRAPGGPPGDLQVMGKCSCDNWVVNEIADTVLEAMPVIAQVCKCRALLFSTKKAWINKTLHRSVAT